MPTAQKEKLILSRENYHSIEADRDYLSVSQFKSFMQCEAATVAYLSGDYRPPDTNALLVGSYVHAALESQEAHEKFIEDHNGAIFKKRGGKYADFEQADEMIAAIRRQKLAMFALEGDKEQIFTADLFEAKWKIRVDSINHRAHRFSDIKTTQDLHKRYWSDKYDGWTSFIGAWDYLLQMALYRCVLQEATGYDYTPYIVAVTKESPPNVAVISFDPTRFDFEYEWIEDHMERILKVKAGEVEPIRCEKCDYCRRTKALETTVEVGELIYS